MHPRTITRILGTWMLLFSASLLPPILVAELYRDGESRHFMLLLAANVTIGLILWLVGERRKADLRVRDGFMIVAMLWLVTSLLASVPFLVNLHMHPVDAFFESVSALTTTGATVLTGLDRLPPGILFFRQELQWLGGIGVVVSAIALLPMLGVGGMQLFKAEAPGPVKDEKLAPRIAQTASIMWKLYIGLTLLCAMAYWFAGMNAFDAVAHSFSTVSTGGFSTHDASIGFFNNPEIEGVAIVFMLLGSINFGVHFAAWRGLSLEYYWENEEVRTFIKAVLTIVVLVTALLYLQGQKGTLHESLRVGVFTVASVITSTGFGIDNFALWGSMLPILLIFVSFIGGCGGSTAGGMKVMRVLIMAKSVALEMRRLIHPNMIKPVRLQHQTVESRVVDGVRVFLIVYFAIFVLLMLALLGMGMDLESAFSGVATSINNLGPGLGSIASNFQSVPEAAKWTLSLAMLLGRLEMFTLLVLLSPVFWRN